MVGSRGVVCAAENEQQALAATEEFAVCTWTFCPDHILPAIENTEVCKHDLRYVYMTGGYHVNKLDQVCQVFPW